MVNQYSESWYSNFMDPIPQDKTNNECEFITPLISSAKNPRILDVCCGTGRHYLKKEPTPLELAEEYKGIRKDKSTKATKQRKVFIDL